MKYQYLKRLGPVGSAKKSARRWKRADEAGMDHFSPLHLEPRIFDVLQTSTFIGRRSHHSNHLEFGVAVSIGQDIHEGRATPRGHTPPLPRYWNHVDMESFVNISPN